MLRDLFTHKRQQAASGNAGSLSGRFVPFRAQQERCAHRCLTERFLRHATRLAIAILFFTVSTLCAFSSLANAATITNAAWLYSGTQLLSQDSVSVTSTERTPATLTFYVYRPGSSLKQDILIQPTEYHPTGTPVDTFELLPPPDFYGTPLPLDQPLPLVNTGNLSMHTGEPLFITLDDGDQNRDPAVMETVLVTISSNQSGDTEQLRLTETGPDTGIFSGHLMTDNNHGSSGDGLLEVIINDRIDGFYIDVDDQTDTSADTLLVDPFGIVFDSLSGEPVDGVKVTLYDVTNNQPADDIRDDFGQLGYPHTVLTGDTDLGLPPGGFRFPLIEPGRDYRLDIEPVSNYSAPSSVPPAELRDRFSQFEIDDIASYGGSFFVNPGPAINIDVPLDPATGPLWIRKTADRDEVAIGDYLRYTLTLDNSSSATATGELRIADHLPLGFRYQSGSLRIDNLRAADPAIDKNARAMEITVDNLQAGKTLEITYVVEIGGGAKLGKAINYATVTDSDGESSNTAQARVFVRDIFFENSSFLLGRVMIGNCDTADTAKAGLGNVRIYLEDGSYVDTDENGNYHFEGIEPGLHVVQVDTLSLPNDYELLACEESNLFAERKFSQFVDLQGGTLWRADFYTALKKTASPAPPQEQLVESQPTDKNNLSSVEQELPIGLLSPADGRAVNRIEAVRVRLKTNLKPRLTVDGHEISTDRIGFRMLEPESKTTLYSYIGVDFGDPGTHKLKIEGIGPFGNARFSEEAEIVRTGAVTSIRLLEVADNLADGRTPVRIRVELIDEFGRQLQNATSLGLEDGNLKPLGITSAEEYDVLELDEQVSVVTVDAQGWISFDPVDQSGYFPLKLVGDETVLETEIFVKPHMRDWILVGFAEGTAGYNNLSGNQVSLNEADIDEHYYEDGRVKFFAKGAIKGEWLLTMAYDSDKPNLDGRKLRQIIDPDSYYPLYGDGTYQDYETSSARDIFVKLERDQFYAMFGDMNTNLNQTELSRYSRTMNGFKSEMQTYRFSYTMFAADTRQAFAKDEIPGDGTSGRYYLSTNDVVINSDQVVIETRDRLRNEIIISSETLNRYTDYDIDYASGSLYFKRPVPNRDNDFNPVFIVVRYETYSASGKNLNYGGRAAYRLLNQRVEVGASYVHEEEGDAEGDLYGVDVSVDLTPQTSLRVEAATTDKSFYKDDEQGDAYIAEIRHDTARISSSAYFREIEGKFGLGQLNNNESDMRKYGAETRYIVNPKLSLAGLAYHEDNLSTGAKRDVATVDSSFNYQAYSLHAGLRYARDEQSDGSSQQSNQLLTGASWVAPTGKLRVYAEHEQSIGSNENSDFPTLLRLGADYKLSPVVSVFADHEFTWGDEDNTQSTRTGLRATPWQGGNIDTTLEQQTNENGQRVFALFGLGQTWRINQNWSASTTLERGQMVKSTTANRVNPNSAPAYGADDDFTSISIGSTYSKAKWSWWNRLETRQADHEDTYGVSTSIVGEPQDGIAVSARALAFISDISDGTRRTDGNIRMGLAYRPASSSWIILNRLDFYFDREDHSSDEYDSWRMVNNLHANLRLNRKLQMSFYYGLKYVRDNFDGRTYSGYTDLIASESRYNINKRWDIGVHGSALHSWNSNTIKYSAGADIGYSPITNTWISVGYNLVGFEDEDFSNADYTAHGVYMRMRVKFDQQSVRDAVKWINR